MLVRPLLWWAIAAVWLVHDVMGNVLTPQRSDATSVIQAGYRWLHDPAAIYADTARHLAQTGLVPVTGLIRPPAAAMLAAPFSLLPGWMQVPAWTVADAAAAVIGLWIVQRYVTRTSLEMAVFWAVAFYSPPLYAEVNAGQIGGFVLLFACLGLVTFRRRPALSGVLVAAAASLKLYPALMVLGARSRWRPFVIAAGIAGALITVVACIPLGAAGAWGYVTGVLIPSLRAPNPDCAQTSVATLFGRSIGGDAYPIITPSGGISILQSPIHLAALATVLTDARRRRGRGGGRVASQRMESRLWPCAGPCAGWPAARRAQPLSVRAADAAGADGAGDGDSQRAMDAAPRTYRGTALLAAPALPAAVSEPVDGRRVDLVRGLRAGSA